ncbi:peptidylprolyl isomerase [Micromonospora sp. HM5-17]|jgi:peptidyl-prolyl cis-trans isomerase B (cyclophilin B)|nr:peptidylprolyl isomerase [Micromonospora sp. HM5-17]
MIGLISAAVVGVLCLGAVCVGLVSYYLSEGRIVPTSDDPPPPAPLACAATRLQGQPDTRTVGLPDFDGAPRSGTATMRLDTNLGTIVITMDRAKTPCTVASFHHLAEQRFFDGSSCHRLVTEGIFVLQCGDPSGTGRGGPDYRFADENLSGAVYTRGVVAMANTGEPNTNGSQFFIIFRDTELPPAYTPFGTVTTGLDIVDRVAAGGHDNSYGSSAGGGAPNIPITFQSVTVS